MGYITSFVLASALALASRNIGLGLERDWPGMSGLDLGLGLENFPGLGLGLGLGQSGLDYITGN